ncbi:hypothetical protein FHT85_005195 [Rhizobium sp. BK312]|nr:hypothetical protein [Rhizobium sp. BK312]
MFNLMAQVKANAYLYLYRFIISILLVVVYIYFDKSHFIAEILIILCLPGAFAKYIIYFGRQDEYKSSKNKRFFWAFELVLFIWNGFRNF